ncbi:MAG TPA: polysaccharide biosynthesis tyrosine autokinase [Solirubrobacterales bacterium]|nr:polysaccharide biosynthesis tyrosine autokinase [Solirubrobacterales bacterium]
MRTNDGALEYTLRVLRRRKFVILAALITVPLVAFLYSAAQTKEYTASATLLFEGEEQAGLSEAERRNATLVELAGLPVVGAKAAEELGVGYSEVAGSVEVASANENANITTIAVTNESPEAAAKIANAYARATINFQQKSNQAKVKAKIALLEKKLEGLSAEEAASPKASLLKEHLDQLEIEEALQTGETSLVQEATAPSSPSKPKTKRNVTLGIILGLVLGLALAALIERLDRRIRSVEELEELFGLPIIARIPKSKAFQDAGTEAMLQAPEAETFRTLRTNLRYLNVVNRDLDSLLITSPEPNDGKSTVARGLAGAMAELGDEVVLVEADLRKDSSFSGAQGRRSEGLAGVLAGADLDQALIEVPVSRGGPEGDRSLTVLPSGAIAPNPSELLESERMRELLATLGERFDVVIIDSPAIGVFGDAMALVPLVSGSLAVGGLGKTTREGAQGFVEQLELTGSRPLGLVVTMTAASRNKYAYYRKSGALSRG